MRGLLKPMLAWLSVHARGQSRCKSEVVALNDRLIAFGYSVLSSIDCEFMARVGEIATLRSRFLPQAALRLLGALMCAVRDRAVHAEDADIPAQRAILADIRWQILLHGARFLKFIRRQWGLVGVYLGSDGKDREYRQVRHWWGVRSAELRAIKARGNAVRAEFARASRTSRIRSEEPEREPATDTRVAPREVQVGATVRSNASSSQGTSVSASSRDRPAVWRCRHRRGG